MIQNFGCNTQHSKKSKINTHPTKKLWRPSFVAGEEREGERERKDNRLLKKKKKISTKTIPTRKLFPRKRLEQERILSRKGKETRERETRSRREHKRWYHRRRTPDDRRWMVMMITFPWTRPRRVRRTTVQIQCTQNKKFIESWPIDEIITGC